VSVPERLEIQDHVSRKRVRTPAQMGTYDRKTWEPVKHEHSLAQRWQRVLGWKERLSRSERQRPLTGEPTGELGENRQVGVEPDPIKLTDSEGE
jgi:hypothetical protein